MFRGLLLMLCACALLAPVAAAAEDEIFVDPGSPSGKEYALPIDSARKQAAPQVSGGKTSGAKQTPLFGEGVGDRSSDGAGGGSGSDAGGGSGRDGAASPGGASRASKTGRTSTSPGTAPNGGTPVTARAQAASPEGGIGTVAFIGAGAGVLLLGAALGLLLRRRSARTT